MICKASRIAGLWLALSAGLTHADDASDWPRWRGPRDNGSIDGGSYPVRWDADRVKWKAPLPGKGCSTPIVWNRRIYVTAPVDGQDAVLAFDWSGKKLWQTTFGQQNPGKHRNGSGSNASPTTDGQGLFVYYKSGTLAGLNLDGSVRWQTNLVDRFGPDTLFWDHGTSPVLTGDCVLMARMHNGQSWLAAFDKMTGEMRWKVPRNYNTPTEGDHGYTTPLVIRHGDTEAVMVWGAEHITVHDASDGRVLWSCGDFNPRSNALWPAISSPVVAGEMVVIAYGRNDRGQPRLHGVRLGGEGDVTKTHRVWNRDDTGTFVPTPVEYQGRIYLLRDRGQVECLDPGSGETLWSDALPRSRTSYYASPTIAGGNLYAAREDGVVFVAKVTEQFELLAENDMGEPIIASPVPVDNHLFLRGEKHLFCITDQ
jgi:outer membrane protein assembly factor BamB